MDELTAQQARAVAALLTCRTLKEAAEVADCSYESLHGWLKNDIAFRAAYREARRQATEHAIAQLQRASHEAASYMVSLVRDEGATHRERLSAARAVMEIATEGVELLDLEERIGALEARTGG